MMKKILYLVTLFVSVLSLSGVGHAEDFCNYYGCVNFPGGISSFADEVVSYNVGSGGVIAPYNDPSNALGAPNYTALNNWLGYVSLGEGGSIVLKFTDNSLTGSGNSNLDLWIFEVGPAVESTKVEISKDGITWVDLGFVSGSTSGKDVDAYGVGPGNYYSYVRLTDDIAQNFGTGDTAGADIDAVGAITTAPPVTTPEPSTMLLIGLGLIGLTGLRKFRK